MEDPGTSPGIVVIAGNQLLGDIQRDLSHPTVQNATGKLGRLGKRIDVRGHSAQSGLDEELSVEVYDDFPSMALLSVRCTNSDDHETSLGSVTLQKHRLNAALAEKTAKPHEMWAFFGASLKWGKDEILPVPARFSQRNPLSEPVDTGDELGRVRGGMHWKKWISLYNEKMLAKGECRDLYVYGDDSPEVYAIEKDGGMYYAFYAPAKSAAHQIAQVPWRGEIELRGLSDRTYRVTDYVHGKDFGVVKGSTAKLSAEIRGSLLLEVR